MTNQIIKTQEDFKLILAKEYLQQIKNFFGNDQQALKFCSAVMSATQRNPVLLTCTAPSLINSFLTMAQLQLMPSDVGGEAYVLPYRNKGVMEAQFQLGYQGLITLFYRAGGQQVRAEVVRDHDEFSYENGNIHHIVDIRKSREERGEAIAAYAIATINDQDITLAMNKADIVGHGQRFSKSFNSDYSPWNEKNDPELWMWKKTVLKQLGKLLPKNETINRAIAEDNKESVMHDRIEAAKEESNGMRMGMLVAPAATSSTVAEDPVYEPVEEPKEESAVAKSMKKGIENAQEGKPLPGEPPKTCSVCAKVISDPEYVYSTKQFNQPLCRMCQKK